MVTGDNIETAMAIAKDAGILLNDTNKQGKSGGRYKCMTGAEFRAAIGGDLKEIEENGKTKEVIPN